jgi:hypothetical protein
MPPTAFNFPGIVEHHYNFCAWLLPKISKFQKDQRYLLGARLENAALDILEYLINASVTEGATKEEWLVKASQLLEHVRFQLRLSHSIKMINAKTYEYGSGLLVETGKMLGGWVKNSRSNTDTPRRRNRSSALTTPHLNETPKAPLD